MSAVSTEIVDRVLVLRIDDGKVNALTTAMIGEIRAALDRATADDVGALAIIGRPGRFSAGFDLTVMRGGDVAAVVGLVSDGGELVTELYASPVPVIAGCTGHALAAGALLLLGSDIRIGADVDCKIGLNEVAIGLVMPRWVCTIAEARLNRAALQRAVVTAEVTGAHGAVAAGYLDDVVDAADLEAATMRRAAELAALHPTAYARTAGRMRDTTVETMRRQIAADRAAGESLIAG